MADSDVAAGPPRGTGRDALIDAAIEVLATQGRRRLTYRSVAEQAGVTHGLVRHHFRSLDSLLQEAVDRWASTSVALTSIEPGTGEIEDLASELVDNVRQHAEEHRVMYEILAASGHDDALRERLRQVYARYAEAVTRELVRIGIADDDGVLGQLVFAAIDGLVLQQLIYGDGGPLEAGLERLRAILRELR